MSESTAKTVDRAVEQEPDKKAGKAGQTATSSSKEKRKRRSRWGAAPSRDILLEWAAG